MYNKYTGVVLKNYPLGEADELLTIYTREAGKLRVVARGLRRIKSRLAGALQCLNEVEFETASGRKPASGGRIPVLVSARVKMVNEYLRQNLKKFAFILVGIETLYRMTADNEPSVAAYDLLLKLFRDLRTASDESVAVRQFQVGLLREFGYAPAGLTAVQGDEIDRILQMVLERDIKANNFLKMFTN